VKKVYQHDNEIYCKSKMLAKNGNNICTNFNNIIRKQLISRYTFQIISTSEMLLRLLRIFFAKDTSYNLSLDIQNFPNVVYEKSQEVTNF